MNIFSLQRFMICAVLAAEVSVSGSQITLLYSFSGVAGDGANPPGSPALAGAVLYGTTPYGGSANFGTLFRMNTDGTGYTNLYHFRGTSADGSEPGGSPLLSETVLYGLTPLGGPLATNGFTLSEDPETLTVTTNWIKGIHGTLFKLDTVSGVYTSLHNFTGIDLSGNSDDGSQPQGDLILDGSVLYGSTRLGGTDDEGTVFKLNTDGSGYTVLRSFTGGVADGAMPCGSLTAADGVLYGQTTYGGSYNYGTVYRMNTDGTGYTVLYSFRGAPWDGSHPQGALLLSGETLYGLTPFGGTNGFGTVFRIGTDGTGYGVLCHFTGTVTNSAHPYGSPVLDNGMLYGITAYGGGSNAGTLFRVSTNGSGFQVLHSFTGGSTGGAGPYGSPVLSGGKIYGMTSQGGTAGEGILFSLTVPYADIDADGLPDWWEEQYFGASTNADASATAANGLNTIEQTYIAGLDPTDPLSTFDLAAQPAVSPVAFRWNAVSGRVYSVYWTTNLLSGFELLETGIVWPQNSWTDQVNGVQGSGFYRIKVRLEQ